MSYPTRVINQEIMYLCYNAFMVQIVVSAFDYSKKSLDNGSANILESAMTLQSITKSSDYSLELKPDIDLMENISASHLDLELAKNKSEMQSTTDLPENVALLHPDNKSDKDVSGIQLNSNAPASLSVSEADIEYAEDLSKTKPNIDSTHNVTMLQLNTQSATYASDVTQDVSQSTALHTNDVELKVLISPKTLRNVSNLQDYELTDNHNNLKRFSKLNVKRRYGTLGSVSRERLICALCKKNGDENKDQRQCLGRTGLSTKRCNQDELCYIEINRRLVQRGCVMPTNVNRTFACKCSLCNDRPYEETPYYERVNDWRYDNRLLQQTLFEDMTLCKDCVTSFMDEKKDQVCREGSHADNIVCDPGQICGTTISGDDSKKHVWRGCLNKPFYNSFWYICNESMCNTHEIIKGQKILPLALHLAPHTVSSRAGKPSQNGIIFIKSFIIISSYVYISPVNIKPGVSSE